MTNGSSTRSLTDLLIDFGRYPVGTEVTMLNLLGTGTTRPVMRFRITGRARDDSAIPTRLSTIEPLDRSKATMTRQFDFRTGNLDQRHGWLIDGYPFDPHHAVAHPRAGSAEIWRLVGDLHHPVHLHAAAFRILTRNGKPPGPLDGGLKDTVDMRPAETVEILATFGNDPGRYVFHCHNLEHEDMGMMATFHIA